MKNHALAIIPDDIIEGLSKKDLVILLKGEQSIRQQMQNRLDRIAREKKILEEEIYDISGKYFKLKSFVFDRKSEKSLKDPKPKDSGVTGKQGDKSDQKEPKHDGRRSGSRNKSLTERYPNLPIVEQTVEFATDPECSCCHSQMHYSGMTEDSEFLDVVPRKYRIIRRKRQKFRCMRCHGDLKTAPNLRIKPGSAYSDDFILDVALSKYCDLIPIERYAAMGSRSENSINLPANSLVSLTHFLADFVKCAYLLVKLEIMTSLFLSADETTHRMLEGDERTNWYLWGFSSTRSVYFEHHDSRAGKVAISVLKDATVLILLTDAFSGYSKTVKEINKLREQAGLQKLISAFCNAHARRKFKEAESRFGKEVAFYLDCYKKIYSLEARIKNISPRRRKKMRRKMRKIFENMKIKALPQMENYSVKSDFYDALSYFTKNYDELTVFIKHPHVSIDNNRQEGLLRSPVVGRKTWLGTHSKRGAKTASILFTLVESCKLNGINPRQYFQDLVKNLHSKKPAFTPAQYRDQLRQGSFASL